MNQNISSEILQLRKQLLEKEDSWLKALDQVSLLQKSLHDANEKVNLILALIIIVSLYGIPNLKRAMISPIFFIQNVCLGGRG